MKIQIDHDNILVYLLVDDLGIPLEVPDETAARWTQMQAGFLVMQKEIRATLKMKKPCGACKGKGWILDGNEDIGFEVRFGRRSSPAPPSNTKLIRRT